MWIRAILATLAFGILGEAVSRSDLFYDKNPLVGFLFVVIAASIFSKKMAKMALGTVVIFLALVGNYYLILDSAIVSSVLKSMNIDNDFTGGIIMLFVSTLTSTFLYLVARYRVWELTGSLTIFIAILYLEFYDLEGRSQAAGVYYGLIVTVALFTGIANGALIRYFLTRHSRINNEDEQLALFRFQLGIAPPSD